MGLRLMTNRTPEQDELIKEFCRENDVGKMKACPKCAMGGQDAALTMFCTHRYCPIREWRNSLPEEKARREKAAADRQRAEEDKILQQADEIRAKRASAN